MEQQDSALSEPLLPEERVNETCHRRLSERPETSSSSSSVGGAIFNFTNSIIGAGAIGLGGAFAQSGGLISIATLLVFAVLTKCSLDLVVQLSLEQEQEQQIQQQQQQQEENRTIANETVDDGISRNCQQHDQQQETLSSSSSVTAPPPVTYEDLGRLAFGPAGQATILTSKLLYSFGCLVAYVIVVKDNLGPALLSLVYGEDNNNNSDSLGHTFLSHDDWVTWVVSLLVILPLCLLRDMTPLAAASFVGIIAMFSIVWIVIYLYVRNPNDTIRYHDHFDDENSLLQNNNSTNADSDAAGGNSNKSLNNNNHHHHAATNSPYFLYTLSFYHHWLQIRWRGYLECLGTFVFTFVSQHTAHMTFQSLQPQLRTLTNWKRITTVSISLATAVSLAVGLVVYLTFWSHAQSDIFLVYPHILLIDWAKLLLCIAMLVTFPLPFFTCRELLIVVQTTTTKNDTSTTTSNNYDDSQTFQSRVSSTSDLEQPLITVEEEGEESVSNSNGPTQQSASSLLVVNTSSSKVLMPGESKQLLLPYHVALSVLLWLAATTLAVSAPSLGDVLDLVGCASGTIIAFLFPACLSLKLRQTKRRQSCCCCFDGSFLLSILLLVVGVVVGVIGTYFSLRKLVKDMM